MGRPLEELGNTMTSEEFGLHLALEIERNTGPAPAVDPDLAAAFGVDGG